VSHTEASSHIDFAGILKQGEVYFNPTGRPDDVLEGEALVIDICFPCMNSDSQSSDLSESIWACFRLSEGMCQLICTQYDHVELSPKVLLVNKPELSYLHGVIILNTDTSSARSIASMLSGGDLDGGESRSTD
jgi:hypothetical protein